MGSTGKSVSGFEDFSAYTFTPKSAGEYITNVGDIFKENSNIKSWLANLTPEERAVISDFVGSEYEDINGAQYRIPWEDMSQEDKNAISRLHNALSKFELNKPITVNRATSFRIFGADDDYAPMTIEDIKAHLSKTGEVVQNDGFMSFSTRSDGIPVEGTGLIIHLKIPPSKGAGAYIGNNYGIASESEFLVNTNTVMRFDKNSLYKDKYDIIHITADWLGRAEAQTISPTYTGKIKK